MIFDLIGGLGIFLFGMKNMSEGLQAVAGTRLRKMISVVTDNRLLAVGVGLFITCVVQSSSVTTVMVVGLVNSGFMTLMQAIGVIFGANIGTTITGWILTLKIGKYGLPMLGVAAFFFLFSKNERVRYTGMVFMGIGMIFFGLELMSGGLKPIRSIPEFAHWFARFQADSYFGVLKCALVGCLLTMIVQSSSATLGITMGLAKTGVIGFETAAALVLGENIGTTITAYLASLGASTNAKRAAYSHAVFNILGVAWITAIFPIYIGVIRKVVGHDPGVMVLAEGVETFPYILAGIALVHTGFNVTNTILFIPLLRPLAWLVTKIAPDKGTKETPHLTYLDIRMLDTPNFGLAQSKKELVFMGESIQLMMDKLREVLQQEKPNEELKRKIFHREDILDNVQKEITVFLGQLMSGRVTHSSIEEARIQLRAADELESISDYITNVMKMYLKLRKNKLEISEEGLKEILNLHDAVRDYLDMVIASIKEPPTDIVSRAHSRGDDVTRLMKEYRRHHLSRLAEEKIPPLKSLIYMDMLNAYRRIRDHGLNVAEALGGEK
ncbi:MAG: Na/Pi cotransporter family protein [Verrucomicrobia bacterium]|nr:Na/Pi cotransporter family protein [Verrucomicrobiota bacterium]